MLLVPLSPAGSPAHDARARGMIPSVNNRIALIFLIFIVVLRKVSAGSLRASRRSIFGSLDRIVREKISPVTGEAPLFSWEVFR
jgi:hypothetical protein